MGRPSVAKSRHRCRASCMYTWRWPHASRAGCKTCLTSFGLVHVLALDVFWERLGTLPTSVVTAPGPGGCRPAPQAVVSQLRWPLAEGRVSAPGMCASVAQCPAALPLRSPKVQLGHMALRIPPFLLPSWGTWWLQVFCASDGTPPACPLSRPTEQFKTNCHHGRPYS